MGKAYATERERSTGNCLRMKFYYRNRFFAQHAASAITGSESWDERSMMGINDRSPLLAIAIRAFLRRPERFARFTGELRKFSRNSLSDISASQANAGFTNPSRG